jgi:Domain of unknown function (DUF5615)
VGRPLTRRGHAVRTLDSEPSLEGLADGDVLALSTSDERILITFDVADFPPILREWAEAGRSHAGVILVHGIRHNEFGLILTTIGRLLAEQPVQAAWHDRAAVAGRASAS